MGEMASRKSGALRLFWSILLIGITSYVVFCLYLFFMQPKLIYLPDTRISATPSDVDLDFQDLTLIASDGVKLSAWYVPAENAELTVLFCHGNAGDISDRIGSVKLFNELGVNCLVFDYRGYGNSEGKPSEKGLYRDSMAAYDWLVYVKGVAPEKVVIFGRSLGGAVAAWLAREVDSCSLVLESCFASMVDMGRTIYPWMPVHLFVTHKFETVEYVKQVNVPILIIHSRDDDIIPFELGRKVYDSANEPKKFAEIYGGHNNGFMDSGVKYVQIWRDWLDELQIQD